MATTRRACRRRNRPSTRSGQPGPSPEPHSLCGSGAAGSLALVLRKRWALPLLVISLVGVVMQDAAFLRHADLVSQVGGAVWVMQGIVLAVAIGLVVLARRASARGWLA